MAGVASWWSWCSTCCRRRGCRRGRGRRLADGLRRGRRAHEGVGPRARGHGGHAAGAVGDVVDLRGPAADRVRARDQGATGLQVEVERCRALVVHPQCVGVLVLADRRDAHRRQDLGDRGRRRSGGRCGDVVVVVDVDVGRSSRCSMSWSSASRSWWSSTSWWWTSWSCWCWWLHRSPRSRSRPSPSTRHWWQSRHQR